MQWLVDESGESTKVAEIIQAAGGRVIGRTRLQKMFYLLEAAGFEQGFHFAYKHYGPYSEELSRTTAAGCMEGLISEEEHAATWGGTYSVFSSNISTSNQTDPRIQSLVALANAANPIDLELAATAIFLAKEQNPDPWGETQKRKPDKAKRIGTAKQLFTQLSQLPLPLPLPMI